MARTKKVKEQQEELTADFSVQIYDKGQYIAVASTNNVLEFGTMPAQSIKSLEDLVSYANLLNDVVEQVAMRTEGKTLLKLDKYYLDDSEDSDDDECCECSECGEHHVGPCYAG